MQTLTILFEAEITVDVAGFETTTDESDIAQAVQDEIGHTGARVTEVVTYSAAVD